MGRRIVSLLLGFSVCLFVVLFLTGCEDMLLRDILMERALGKDDKKEDKEEDKKANNKGKV